MQSPTQKEAPTPDPVNPRLARHALFLSGVLLAASLLFQRFALPVAGKVLSLVTPIGLVLMVYGFATGTLCFHRRRLVIFLAFAVAVLAGALWQAVHAGGLGGGENANSRVLFVLLTSFATCTFAAPVAETAFFRMVNFAFLLVAIAGIGQFFAQFVGLSLFSFAGHVPDSLLVEQFYNLEIPVGVGTMLKANGLVLIEPSVFSQTMALALIIEVVGTARFAYVATFVLALLLSFSGTGWIVLGAFVLGSAIGMGWRGVAIAAGVTALLGTVVGVLSIAAPDIATALLSRVGEINQPGTSGHMRFVTPFWMLSDVFSAEPSAVLVGIGSGKSELLTLPYDYAINTAIKVLAEYGAPALILYGLLFVTGERTRVQTALLAPALVLFFLAGGYQDYAPVIFIVLLLIVVPRLQIRASPGSRHDAGRKPAPFAGQGDAAMVTTR